MKICPFCAEEIQDKAIKCKHCGEWLEKDVKDSNLNVVDTNKILPPEPKLHAEIVSLELDEENKINKEARKVSDNIYDNKYILIAAIIIGSTLRIFISENIPLSGISFSEKLAETIAYESIGFLFWIGFIAPLIGAISNADRYYNLKSITIAIYIGNLYKILRWYLPLP